jgi:hypothetical protein
VELEPLTIIEYNGAIRYDTIGELIHQFKSSIHLHGVQIGTYKKILLVMIESLENIMKYGGCPPSACEEAGFNPAFSIVKEKNQYTIATRNMVAHDSIASLENRLNHLNTLNQQGIKEFYKETITNGKFSNLGGAGLGLIEMAKISGKKIEFMFHPVNEKYAAFTLMIRVEESNN